ncbi:unnamed protein product [Parnassius mnemosyne]|uniref:BHLH domain-containing protein n=1 Tax=Parnassius mnemosyne TaxID=213953 RepID=A0AAV1KG33_9NEOP
METTTNKHRTPSRCREWERQRRNRFNEAITKLGEVVKEMLKNDTKSESSDSVQFPKIEIVQKAILCLTNCAQEKTQLKGEILALQVKLEAEKNVKPDKKDASIQVSAVVCRKNKNGKYVRLMMLQKSKKNVLKEKPPVTIDDTASPKPKNKSSQENATSNKSIQKLPKLLPLPNINTKKGIENTIVMLSGAPYILPQRPLLFPAVPPAIVLLDPNIQTINKSTTGPVVNRNMGDMTKTTMVNILPISAYSRPLSATRPKKNNSKSKPHVQRKTIKKVTKPVVEVSEESLVSSNKKQSPEDENKDCKAADVNSETSDKEKNSGCNNASNENNNSLTADRNTSDSSSNENSKTKPQIDEDIISTFPPKTSDSSPVTISLTSTIIQKPNVVQNMELREIDVENTSKANKISSEKDLLLEEKDKENKLPNILDTALCDNVVDGGNARLELAEEFLAASPTAAFLMSFPLVSGNRADSPAEENHSNVHVNSKDQSNNQRRNDIPVPQPPYFPKPNDAKVKSTKNNQNLPNVTHKHTEHQRFINSVNVSKDIEPKVVNQITLTNSSSDNPFLNLPIPTLISTSCTPTDSTFSLDFDCNISKANQSVSSINGNNFFYKSDPLNTAKSTIYSTSNISSGHEFNSIGLYPCAMENFSTKNKSDFTNVEENLMKIGPSRLTYDIDLGWSHKGFDFVACTTSSSTFNKDNILTTAPTQYSTSYNPFNPEFHVPLVSSSSKKENIPSKAITSFPEAITSFYSQPSNLWSEDMSFYSSNNFSKNFTPKPQNFAHIDHAQTNINLKANTVKQISDTTTDHNIKPIGEPTIISDKYTKKSSNKMHINWMTSEIRPMQNNCISNQTNVKESNKTLYSQVNPAPKKHDHTDGNYFPINMHNFPTQVTQEEFQVWPTARPAGTTEISIEPPPINLPTLVGDLALGPHDKKKNDAVNRVLPQSDLQNCNNFFSVTQLMNRSSDVQSRYQGPNMETTKSNLNPPKQNISNINSDSHRKPPRIETQLAQPCYAFNEPKPMNYESMGQLSQTKQKNNKSDKSSKSNQKTSYSAEALIRGAPCNQKTQDTTISKFMFPSQKFNDFNMTQDSGVAQVSHFPPLLEYPDNSYTGQQFSGTTLYNSTTNTISNSFYSNFMPGSSNLMTGNYASGPFQSEYIDYNQPAECNYSNYKYEDLKMKANTAMLLKDKPTPMQYKGTRRETSAKHKLECSKKDSNKKCNSKRAKLTNDVEEWSESAHLLWQSKTTTKRHPNVSDDLSFPNYVSNQISAGSQYQSEFFNTHLMPSNMQNVSHNIDRSLASFPATSRANFNLSTIFPEITMVRM